MTAVQTKQNELRAESSSNSKITDAEVRDLAPRYMEKYAAVSHLLSEGAGCVIVADKIGALETN